jgi:hypothetical protein
VGDGAPTLDSAWDSATILRGLETRLRLASLTSSPHRQRPNQKSSVVSISEADLLKAPVQTAAIHLFQYINRVKTVREQERLLRHFQSTGIFEPTDLSLVGHLAIGKPFIGPLGLGLSPTTADSDLSIALLPQIAGTASTDASRLLLQIRRLIGRYYKTRDQRKVRSWNDLTNFLRKYAPPETPPVSMSSMSQHMALAKQTAWAVVGSDVFSFLQSLLDPVATLTDAQVTACMEVCRLWKIESIAARLLLLRSLGGYHVEYNYVQKNISEVVTSASLLPYVSRLILQTLASGGVTPPYLNSRSRDHTTALLVHALNVSNATARLDQAGIRRYICEAYETDPTLAYMLNWRRIHNAFDLPSSLASPTTIFIKHLMGTPVVARRFKDVAIARGTGALTADLTSYIEKLRNPTLAFSSVERSRPRNIVRIFLRGFLALRPRSRIALFNQILDRTMIERLANAFPSSITNPKNLIASPEGRPSLLRIELVKNGVDLGMISKDRATKIIEDETNHLRQDKFNSIYSGGRVRIDWQYLEEEFCKTFEDDFEFLFQLLPQFSRNPHSDDAEVLKQFIAILSKTAASAALSDSPASLAQSLSNNLKHGVIVPRFMRAFGDTFAAVARLQGRTEDVSDANYRALFGKDGAITLLKLRQQAQRVVEDFQERQLNVAQSTSVEERLASDFEKTLLGHTGTAKDAIGIILRVYEESVSKFLDGAREYFEKTVRGEMSALIGKTRSAVQVKQTRSSGTRATTASNAVATFVDFLEGNLEQAGRDVAKWLALSAPHGDGTDFKISDLVKFEATTLILADYAKLSVKYTYQSGSRSDAANRTYVNEPTIAGAYFEAFHEIIHNLISNAYSKSGLDVKTAIEVRTVLSGTNGTDMTISCANTFAQNKADSIKRDFPSTVRKAKNKGYSKSAGKEGLSGFSKIRLVCDRVLGKSVAITVQPPNFDERIYRVDVLMPKVVPKVFADIRE